MKELLPFQAEAVEVIGDQNFLLADDCGLGKTYVAVEIAKLYADGPVLVVCPKGVKLWWAQVIKEQMGEDALVHVAPTAGRGIPYHLLRPGYPMQWVIMHPTALRIQVAEGMPLDVWDLVIADEAHRFKNRKAKRTKALWRVQARQKLALTGTPYGKDPSDVWALMHWLYPKGHPQFEGGDPWRQIVFKSFTSFFERFVEYYQPPGRKWVIIRGGRNLDRLGQLLAPLFLRRGKDLLDLPELLHAEVPILLNEEQQDLYTTLLRDAYAFFGGTEVVLENALVRLLRLHQAALDPGLVLPEWEEEPAKVAWLNEWLEDHPDEPVVVVSRYRKFVERWLRELAPDSCVVGGMSPRQVEAALASFRRDGRLVGSLAAMCEGLNLHAASTMIITDGTWSPAMAYQLEQRIHRIGQTRTCQIIHLVGRLGSGKATVDHLLRRAHRQRWEEARILHEFVQEVLHERANA